MKRLASMSLIPKFASIKSSKCQMCVQSKQPRKPHKVAEARNLAPLELVHSDLCEMNGVLTKGGKRYFMTLIDDSTRYCYESHEVSFPIFSQHAVHFTQIGMN